MTTVQREKTQAQTQKCTNSSAISSFDLSFLFCVLHQRFFKCELRELRKPCAERAERKSVFMCELSEPRKMSA